MLTMNLSFSFLNAEVLIMQAGLSKDDTMLCFSVFKDCYLLCFKETPNNLRGEENPNIFKCSENPKERVLHF